MEMNKLREIMRPHDAAAIGLDAMPEDKQRTILEWGLHMYGLGQYRVGDIDEIKYDGRVVILDDGSRWEVGSADAEIADVWSPGEKVVVIDDTMYKLDESECVEVTEEA